MHTDNFSFNGYTKEMPAWKNPQGLPAEMEVLLPDNLIPEEIDAIERSMRVIADCYAGLGKVEFAVKRDAETGRLTVGVCTFSAYDGAGLQSKTIVFIFNYGSGFVTADILTISGNRVYIDYENVLEATPTELYIAQRYL